MKRTYIVEVEVEDDELVSFNQKRKRLGQQTATADDVVENIICDALSSKLLGAPSCRPLLTGSKRSPLKHTGDANATL